MADTPKTSYTPSKPPNTPLTRATQPLRALPIPYEALKLSREVDECQPLARGKTDLCVNAAAIITTCQKTVDDAANKVVTV